MKFICECDREDCRELISLTFAEAVYLRKTPELHICIPGHESPMDRVVTTDSLGAFVVLRGNRYWDAQHNEED